MELLARRFQLVSLQAGLCVKDEQVIKIHDMKNTIIKSVEIKTEVNTLSLMIHLPYFLFVIYVFLSAVFIRQCIRLCQCLCAFSISLLSVLH